MKKCKWDLEIGFDSSYQFNNFKTYTKRKSADSAEPTKSEKVYENAKVLSNGTWAKFREMAEEFAETTTKMNEL